MQNQHNFKVGDKVKVVELISRDAESGVVLGGIYEVVSCDTRYAYINRVGMTKSRFMYPSQLELYTEPPKLTPYQYMLDYHGIDEDTWFNIVLSDGRISCVGEVRFTNGILYNRSNTVISDNSLYKSSTVQIVTKSKKELAIEEAKIKLFDARHKVITAEDEFIKAKYDLIKSRNM